MSANQCSKCYNPIGNNITALHNIQVMKAVIQDSMLRADEAEDNARKVMILESTMNHILGNIERDFGEAWSIHKQQIKELMDSLTDQGIIEQKTLTLK